MKRKLTYCLVIVLTACATEAKEDTAVAESRSEPVIIPLNPEDPYETNPVFNDSVEGLSPFEGREIVTGKRQKIFWRAKPRDFESVPFEKIKNPNSIYLYDDSYVLEEQPEPYAIERRTVMVSEKARVLLNSSGEAIITGKEFSIVPNKVKVKQPLSFAAGDFRQKDNVILNIEYLDVAQGLSSPYVYAIERDQYGFLWIATNSGGLLRYDGHSFLHYSAENGLTSRYIMDIESDANGNLWLATQEGGICMFDGEFFYYFTESHGLGSDSYVNLIVDSHNSVWIGGKEGGLVRLEQESDSSYQTIVYSEREGLGSNNINSILERKDGSILFAAEGGGLSAIEEGAVIQYDLDANRNELNVTSIGEDRNGNLWYGTGYNGLYIQRDDSVYHYDRSNVPEFSLNVIFCMTHDQNDVVWLGTNGYGAFQTRLTEDGLPRSFRRYGESDGFSGTYIQDIYEDEYGHLWFSTDGGGINRLKPKSFMNYNETNGLHENYITSIFQDSKGHIWFGGWSNGVAKLDGKSLQHYGEDQGILRGVWDMEERVGGGLWLASFKGGLYYLEDDKMKSFFQQDGLPSDYLYSINYDLDSNLWITTSNAGIAKYDGQDFYILDRYSGLSGTSCRIALPTSDGKVWIAMDDGGLGCLEGDSLTTYTEREGLSTNSILSLYEDSQGRLWIGTLEGGIMILENDSLTTYTTDQGLTNNVVWSIEEAANGEFWVSTDFGINLFIPNDRGSFDIINYTDEDGLRGMDFYSNASLIDADSTIWWGTGRGLTNRNLNHFKVNESSPSIDISHLEINEDYMDFNWLNDSTGISYDSIPRFKNYPIGLELPYDKNHLTFHFSAIKWKAPHKVRYSYRMEGLSEGWSSPLKDNKADFRSLPHGDYTFQLRAYGESGKWTDTFEYHFTILPPWWHTWWARTLYIVFGLLAIYLFVQIRTRQLKARQKELEVEVEAATLQLRNKNEELGFKNEQIAKQKEEVEEAHKEITDSIDYAKRIQSAILPPQRLVEELLPNSFILYLPKDVVAGDFYWLEKKNDTVLFAAADCTGHGVPGAMVSVICNGALNRSVREYGLSKPGEILDKAREIVIKEFEKSEDEVKDGMDIALCCLTAAQSESQSESGSDSPPHYTLQYAGAHNPLWIVRGGEVLETKADKQPIGKFDQLSPYTTHTLELQSGDHIYIFSDGYVDQFGGEKGKKFKAKNFRNLLISIQDKSISEQKQLIEKAFMDWKGAHEQVDDVCVIGLKID